MKSLRTYARADEERLAHLQDLQPIDESDVIEDVMEGPITATFVDNDSFVELTGYTHDQVRNIVEEVKPLAVRARKRGPEPKSSVSDALLCYLVLLKLGIDYPALAKTLHIGESQLKSNIDRIRPLLKEALSEKWAQLLPRPSEDMERNIFEAGLIVDCFTTECFRPKGRFSEAKVYYDGNHWIYG